MFGERKMWFLRIEIDTRLGDKDAELVFPVKPVTETYFASTHQVFEHSKFKNTEQLEDEFAVIYKDGGFVRLVLANIQWTMF